MKLPIFQSLTACLLVRSVQAFTTTAPSFRISRLFSTLEQAPEISSKGNVVARNGKFLAIQLDDDETASGEFTGRKVVQDDGLEGLVVAHRPPLAFLYSDKEWKEGPVKVLKEMAQVKFNSDDKLIHPARVPSQYTHARDIFAPIPQVKDIALINYPCLSGVTMMDALTPIGRGQNMLMIGSDLKMMRGYASDLVKNQKGKCVYAAIEDPSVAKEFEKCENVHVIVPEDTSDEAAFVEAVALASTACAVGEAYARQGEHVTVVIDTIDFHKKLWGLTTRTLIDVFGVDSVVQSDRSGGASSEMRAFYSSLIQRSAQFKASRGGGSLTLLMLTTIPTAQADEDTVYQESDFENTTQKIKERIQLLMKRKIPLTAANLRKIDIPVPSDAEGPRRAALQHVDDLMSMSDGQIWLDERLEKAGQMPPLDPQRSVTRIGIGRCTQSRADAPAFRQMVERLRLDLSQASYMLGAEENTASQKQVRRSKALLLAMHQEPGKGGRRLSESCTALLAASEGLLDDAIDQGLSANTSEGQALIQDLLDHVQITIPDVTTQIDESLDMSSENKKRLTETIASFFVN